MNSAILKKVKCALSSRHQMKTPKTKGILPLSFVNEKLQHPLNDADDFMHRISQHVDEQLEELLAATAKHELPSIKPLAESVQNGMNILDFHLADNALNKIQDKAAKLQDDEELSALIAQAASFWKERRN